MPLVEYFCQFLVIVFCRTLLLILLVVGRIFCGLVFSSHHDLIVLPVRWPQTIFLALIDSFSKPVNQLGPSDHSHQANVLFFVFIETQKQAKLSSIWK